MKYFALACIAFALFSCNSSSTKDPNKVMDDTARMQNPPTDTVGNISSGIKPVQIGAADIPASIKIKGTIQEAWKWNDNLGDNIFITSITAPYDVKDEDGNEARSAEVHAVHYAKKESDPEFIQVWDMDDGVKECPLDMTCGFIPGSTTITDLDRNAIAEIKMQYSVACRGDVSPAYLQLLLYENGVKYVLKGSMWIKYGPDIKYEVTEKDVNLEKMPPAKEDPNDPIRVFGRYESEKDFAAAPPEFLTFARQEWLKYSKERMGE